MSLFFKLLIPLLKSCNILLFDNNSIKKSATLIKKSIQLSEIACTFFSCAFALGFASNSNANQAAANKLLGQLSLFSICWNSENSSAIGCQKLSHFFNRSVQRIFISLVINFE